MKNSKSPAAETSAKAIDLNLLPGERRTVTFGAPHVPAVVRELSVET